MNNLIGLLLVCVAAVTVVLGVVYRFFILPLVRFHFGEESRRDYESIRRRKEFERRCINALGGFYFSCVTGVIRGILSVTMPEFAVWAFAAQIGALAMTGLFVWAAATRWREPFAN